MKILTSALVAVLIFAGCASSKNESSNPAIVVETTSTEVVVQSGTFVDAAVEGLTYKTLTQNGITDGNGTFTYVEGETVAFTLGEVPMGSGVGKAQMTPVDIVEGATDSNNTAVTNILRLLQTLDSDKNASNGIDLSNLQGFQFDGNVSTLDFNSDATLNDIVTQAQVDAVIVTVEDALAHFEENLATLDLETIQANIDSNLTSSDAILWDFVLGGKAGPIYITLFEGVVAEAVVPLDANGSAFDSTKEQYPDIPFDFTLLEQNTTKVVWNLIGSADINGTAQSFDFLYTYTKQ